MNFSFFAEKIKEKSLQPEGGWLIFGPDEKEMFSSILNISLKLSSWEDILIISPEENLPQEIKEKFLNLDPSIESIRQAIRFLSLSPEGEKKILIINNAGLLNKISQNALLKTAEEPNKNVVIFLLCQEESQIITALISRLKKISFQTDLKKYFQERIKKEEILFFEKNLEGDFWKESLNFSDAEKIKLAENLAILARDKILNSLNLENLKITSLNAGENNKKIQNAEKDLEKIDYIFKYISRLKNPSINHRLQLESLFFKLIK